MLVLMVETLSFQENGESGDSTKQELRALAQEVLNTTTHEEQLNSFEFKVQKLLDEAHTIANRKPKYAYGKPYKCDQFVKHLFEKAGDTSLREIYGAKGLYTYFAPDKNNRIKTEGGSLVVSGKPLNAGDLLFFTDASGKQCGHVAVFSRQDPVTGSLYVYDASAHGGIGERKIFPSELTTTYRNIYYTTPSFVG